MYSIYNLSKQGDNIELWCISIFLEELSSLSYSVVFIYFLLCSFKKAFFALCAILRNSAFSSVYPSLSPLPFASLLSSAICKDFSVQFSHSVTSNSLGPHGLQHASPPCPSPTHRVYSNSCPLSWWCHPAISSSIIPFSSLLQSFPTSGSFQMSHRFSSGSQSIWLSASTSVLPINIQDWFPLGWTGWFSLLSKGLKSLLQHCSSKASILRRSAFFIVQLSHSYMTTGKTIALTRWTFVGKVISLLFNIVSSLVIMFLPRSKCLFISWLQSPSAVILEPQKIKSDNVSTVSPSIAHEVMGLDAMIFVFRMLNFKPTLSQLKKLFSSSSLSAIRVVSSAYLRLLIFLPAILISACASSSPAFLTMYSAQKLNKQGDNIQPWHGPFSIWNQSVPCPVLTVASWPAYRLLKRQVRWSGIPISFRIFHSLLWSTESKALA